jgi:hypothetical protein
MGAIRRALELDLAVIGVADVLIAGPSVVSQAARRDTGRVA